MFYSDKLFEKEYYAVLCWFQLIDECLDNRSQERPTFGNIRKILYKINPNKQNPVDLMMAMVGIELLLGITSTYGHSTIGMIR